MANSTTNSTKQTRKRNSKLALAVKNKPADVVWQTLCMDIANQMEDTFSGRDYAALSKSFMSAYDSYNKAVEEAKKKNKPKTTVVAVSSDMSAVERARLQMLKLDKPKAVNE